MGKDRKSHGTKSGGYGGVRNTQSFLFIARNGIRLYTVLKGNTDEHSSVDHLVPNDLLNIIYLTECQSTTTSTTTTTTTRGI
jgi:hypothetical protein